MLASTSATRTHHAIFLSASRWLTLYIFIYFIPDLTPVIGIIVVITASVTAEYTFPAAQPDLTDRAGRQYGTVTVGRAVIARSEPHSPVHCQPTGRATMCYRIDADGGFLAGLKYLLTTGITCACTLASSPVVSVTRKTRSCANQVCASMANLPHSLFILACRHTPFYTF